MHHQALFGLVALPHTPNLGQQLIAHHKTLNRMCWWSRTGRILLAGHIDPFEGPKAGRFNQNSHFFWRAQEVIRAVARPHEGKKGRLIGARHRLLNRQHASWAKDAMELRIEASLVSDVHAAILSPD